MSVYQKRFDIIVVGGGHAGCEAALAGARMGLGTLLLTMNLNTVAQMPCNPAVGGLAKGQLVREVDALGGQIAKNTDKSGLQFRILNKSKGPAVQAPRAQCDRKLYQLNMLKTLEHEKNLILRQAEVSKIRIDNGRVTGVLTQTGMVYEAESIIFTTGTFLNGLIHLGESSFPAGRMGEFPAQSLAQSLRELGFEVRRLNTCTPPRLDGRTVNFARLEVQPGDDPPIPLSHFTGAITQRQLPCYITHTNKETHRVIAENLARAPLHTGQIKGMVPRYCPSIEEKIIRFPERESHQIFLEPEGYHTQEIYCNGLFTSLPEDVQISLIRTIRGLESARIIRPGYAIEYDFCPPIQLNPTLETKLIDGLYFAGQINGTSGYEEAAAQGIMAGINAGLKIRGESPFILDRSTAYIGLLIDDLVTKGTDEPYRMFTSRAEYRLILRSDNADMRLMDFGHKFGLIAREDHDRFLAYKDMVVKRISYLKKTFDSQEGIPLAGILRRPRVRYEDLRISSPRQTLCGSSGPYEGYRLNEERVVREVEIEIKYEGYIRRQKEAVEKFRRLENKKIPKGFDYSRARGLLTESRQKLAEIRPISIGQASRISGVTPADISLLLVYLTRLGGSNLASESERHI